MTNGNPVVVWLDGSLRDPESAGLHWSDHGITVGDGVFETIKLVGAHSFALEEHLDRLACSCAGMKLEAPSRTTIESAVAEVAGQWAAGAGEATTGRLRITVTGGPGPMGSDRGIDGPTLMVTAGPLELSRTPTPVVIVPWTRNERGALSGLKTTSYAENVIALATAVEAGASEAIFANTRAELCEGTGTNVFVGLDGMLSTPPLDSGCLAGITRAKLIEAASSAGLAIREQTMGISALAAADEAFLVSTGREVQPISVVDGVPLPAAPGPLTLAAMAAWDAAYATYSA